MGGCVLERQRLQGVYQMRIPQRGSHATPSVQASCSGKLLSTPVGVEEIRAVAVPLSDPRTPRHQAGCAQRSTVCAEQTQARGRPCVPRGQASVTSGMVQPRPGSALCAFSPPLLCSHPPVFLPAQGFLHWTISPFLSCEFLTLYSLR